MARGTAVIDIDADPFAARADRRRALLRIGVPVLGVVLMISTILLIAFHSYRANRDGALALSNDLLATCRTPVTSPGSIAMPRGRKLGAVTIRQTLTIPARAPGTPALSDRMSCSGPKFTFFSHSVRPASQSRPDIVVLRAVFACSAPI
jgi:hypothetical protein